MGRQVQDTDTTLLRRLRDLGDEKSWTDFYRLYAPFLEHVLVRAGISQADAMDAIQETMAVVSTHIGDFEYDRGKKFRSFLVTIALRFAWKAVRRNQRDPVPLGGTENLRLLHEIPQTQLDEMWYVVRMNHALERVKVEASPGQWKAFKLVVLDGMSNKETASKLGITVSNVYVRKGHVKQRLVEILKEIDD